MAALNERRRGDDGQKTRLAQQGVRAVARHRCRLRMVQPREPEADDGAEPGHGCDHPDQLRRGDHVGQKSADQRSHHERRRTPQPQRPIIETVARHAAQGIGVRQRYHRRPHTGGCRVGEKYQQRPMLGSDHQKPERSGKGCGDHGTAQRVTPFGEAGHERQNCEPGHRGNGGDDADPRRVDPDRLEPHREERQMGADQSEQRAVK